MILKKIFNWVFHEAQKLRARAFIKKIPVGSQLWIFDIDNTLADTWPSLTFDKKIPDYQRLRSLPVFENISSYAKLKEINSFVIYLTHRTPRQFCVTKKWLNGNGMLTGNAILLVVDNVEDKVRFIERYLICYSVVLIDDLSYNHETGNVKFYNEVISAVKNTGVRYVGKEVIDRFNSFKKVR